MATRTRTNLEAEAAREEVFRGAVRSRTTYAIERNGFGIDIRRRPVQNFASKLPQSRM
jgi:hypothetical protein